MEACAISHIASCARDMEKSLAFYRNILGLKVLYSTPASATSQPSVEKEIINLAVAWCLNLMLPQCVLGRIRGRDVNDDGNAKYYPLACGGRAPHSARHVLPFAPNSLEGIRLIGQDAT